MDVEKTLQQLDRLFAQHQLEAVEGFLLDAIGEAIRLEDTGAVITLLNELIGYYREQGETEKCLSYCEKLLQLVAQEGLAGTVPYATTLLNIANAYRAAGMLRESMMYYQQVREIYVRELDDADFRYASLYNNMSLLFQEMGDFESACDCLERALSIAMKYDGARIEVAVTYTNLAISQLKLMRYEEAIENLRRAFAIFEQDEDRDYHYSGALSAMGEAQYLAGNMEESAYYYECALREIERTAGKNQAYEIVKQNLHVVQKQLNELPQQNIRFQNGMELCESFYQDTVFR